MAVAGHDRFLLGAEQAVVLEDKLLGSPAALLDLAVQIAVDDDISGENASRQQIEDTRPILAAQVRRIQHGEHAGVEPGADQAMG